MAETKEEDITRYGTNKFKLGMQGSPDHITKGEASEYNIKYEDEDGNIKTKKEKIHVKVTNRSTVTYDDKGKPTKIDILPDKRKTELYKCEDKGISGNTLNQERINNRECLLLFTRDESDEEKSTIWQADQANLDELGTKIDDFESAMANISNDDTLDKDIRNTVKSIQEGGDPRVRVRAKNGTTDEDKREHLENVAGQTDPDALEQTAATDTTSINTDKLAEELKAKEGTRSNYGNYRYPSGENGKNDFIMFSILEYTPKKFDEKALGFEDREPNRQANNIGTITLPVPAGIKDSNQVDWRDGSMSPLQAGFAQLAFDASNGNAIDQGFDRVQEMLENSSVTGESRTAVRNIFAGRAVGVKNLVARTQGAVINPNLELLFNGPKLRQFSFVYLLTPRDENEAKQIVSIIRTFKQASSVQRTEGKIFLKAPNTFQVTYHRGDTNDENPYIGKMKECAMTSVGVEYTPANVYATFEGGYMTQYRLTLTMQELEPVYNDDYGADEETIRIGY